MKSQSWLAAALRLLVVVVAVLSLTGVATAQAAGLPNQIAIQNQDISNGVMIVSSVTAAADGWIVIYKTPNLTDGEMVGYAPVYKGTNTDVRVTINTARVKDLPTLWARLHVDNGVKGLFEWGLKGLPLDDAPAVQNGQYVIAAFGTSGLAPDLIASTPAITAPSTTVPVAVPAAQAAARPGANRITIRGQDLSKGVIVVDSVIAAADGWIVVYKNPNFTSGEIVGYAPVYKGTNTDVRVTINTAKVKDLPTLWARLHVDNDVKGVFEWGYRNEPYNDPPVVEGGLPVINAFATVGQ